MATSENDDQSLEKYSYRVARTFRSEVVGYARPPVATRFKPGQSGNPKGRPKRRFSIQDVIANVFGAKIVIRTGDKTKRITKLEGLLYRQMEMGLKGDQRALTAAIKTAREFGLLEAPKNERHFDPSLLDDNELEWLSWLLTKAGGKTSTEPGAT